MHRNHALLALIVAAIALLTACGGDEPELLAAEDTPAPDCFTEGFPLTSTTTDVWDLSRTVVDLEVTLDDAPADLCGWTYEVVHDVVDESPYAAENPRVDEIDGGLLVRWLPDGCPDDIELDISGAASAPIIDITPNEPEACPAVQQESILMLATLRPVDADAVTVRLFN